MTTIVTVNPYGHRAEAIVTEVVDGASVETTFKLDGSGETSFSVYDGKSIMVREIPDGEV